MNEKPHKVTIKGKIHWAFDDGIAVCGSGGRYIESIRVTADRYHDAGEVIVNCKKCMKWHIGYIQKK